LRVDEALVDWGAWLFHLLHVFILVLKIVVVCVYCNCTSHVMFYLS
jgi:hypothetical protein